MGTRAQSDDIREGRILEEGARGVFPVGSGGEGKMSEQHDAQRTGLAGRETVFEGGAQETVEILPSTELLSMQQREQGVIARIGRDRVERHVPEGQAEPLPSAQQMRVALERQRRDALQVVIYRISTYYALALATLALAVTVGWVITANWGY